MTDGAMGVTERGRRSGRETVAVAWRRRKGGGPAGCVWMCAGESPDSSYILTDQE